MFGILSGTINDFLEFLKCGYTFTFSSAKAVSTDCKHIVSLNR
jgi:hypothetical protein